MPDQFNPDMLRLARDARELTQSELAEKSGLTQAFISKLEHGIHLQPGSDALQRIADTLGFPQSFFFQQDRATSLPHFHFRKRAKLGSKQLSRISAMVNIRRQHVAKLMRSYEEVISKPIPEFSLTESNFTPEKVAQWVRSYWMLPPGPIDNVVDIIERAGGIVILGNFKTDLLDGISFRAEGLPPMFFMNSRVSGDRFRFSLAHELGHMIMHSMAYDDERMEEEAHRFAASFLMPENEIRRYLTNPKISNLGRVKAFWRVSIKALIRRAYELKVITNYQYKSLHIQYNKSFHGEEPIDIPIEKPRRLAEIVQFHIQRLGYSIGELGQLLCFKAEDIERIYLGGRPGPRLVISNG